MISFSDETIKNKISSYSQNGFLIIEKDSDGNYPPQGNYDIEISLEDGSAAPITTVLTIDNVRNVSVGNVSDDKSDVQIVDRGQMVGMIPYEDKYYYRMNAYHIPDNPKVFLGLAHNVFHWPFGKNNDQYIPMTKYVDTGHGLEFVSDNVMVTLDKSCDSNYMSYFYDNRLIKPLTLDQSNNYTFPVFNGVVDTGSIRLRVKTQDGNIGQFQLLGANNNIAYNTYGTHGHVEGDAYQLLENGVEGSQVTAVPDEGYHFVKWTDGVKTASRKDKGSYEFLSVKPIFETGDAPKEPEPSDPGQGGTPTPPTPPITPNQPKGDNTQTADEQNQIEIEGQTNALEENDERTFNAGYALKEEMSDGRDLLKVILDSESLKSQGTQQEEGQVLSVKTSSESDVIKTALNVDAVESMQTHHITLKVDTPHVKIAVPTDAINVEQIKSSFGDSVSPEQINIDITTEQVASEKKDQLEQAIKQKGYQMLGQPVSISLEAHYNSKVLPLDHLQAYTENYIEIEDPQLTERVTTAVTIDEVGTLHHVPTYIDEIDGKYYAVVHSKNNQTYSLIYNDAKIESVSPDFWGYEALANLSNRLVVSDDQVSHSNDALSGQQLDDLINIALGYETLTVDNTEGYVTREVAMKRVFEAGLQMGYDASVNTETLSKYSDKDSLTEEGQRAAAWCIENHIVSGIDSSLIGGHQNLTLSQLAVMINQLLKNAAYIN